MSHTRWLDRNGNYIHTVRGKKITDAAAKRMGLYPSVTSIIGCFEGIRLSEWKRYQIYRAGVSSPGISYDDALTKAFPTSMADIGTSYHKWIAGAIEATSQNKDISKCEELLRIEDVPKQFYSTFLDWFSKFSVEVISTEERMCDEELGFGGTLDLFGIQRSGKIICDWKTQGRGNGKRQVKFYPSWPIQLAAYASLKGVLEEAELWSVVIPIGGGDIKARNWSKYKPNEYWWNQFQSMYNLWSGPLYMNYDPRR